MAARTSTLEPLRPAILRVSLAHLLVALVVGALLLRVPATSESSSADLPTPTSGRPDAELWLHPADFVGTPPKDPQPAPANPTPPAPSLTTTAPTASSDPAPANSARYITLSRLHNAPSSPSAPPAPPLSTQDLSELDRLDEALYEAFMRAWRPPDPARLDRARRSVRLDVTLAPDVTIVKSDLAAPSGSSELDLSVLAAAEQVAALLRDPKSDRVALKFPAKLPSPLQNSRYDCRILFQLE